MADVTISDLSPITPSTGLVLPVSNGSSTGKVTLSQVCGVMTSAQITTALGYTPYNSTNPNGYISGINSTQVINALGYTPVSPSSHLVPRAWVNFDGTTASTTCTIRSSFNISSVIRSGTGIFNVYFSSSAPSTAYTVIGTAGNAGAGSAQVPAVAREYYTDRCVVYTSGYGTNNVNCPYNSLVIFGYGIN